MPGPGDRGGVKAKPKDAKGALLRIIRYLMEYRWLVLPFLICTFASNLGNLMGPRFAGKAIGEAEEGFKLGIGMVNMAAAGAMRCSCWPYTSAPTSCPSWSASV